MQPRKRVLTAERLRSLISYDPDTGIVRWIGPERSSAGRRMRNRAHGSTLGALFDRQGHLGCLINGERHYLHRLIWLWMTGEWPTIDVDHINRDPSDNRWANLRLATRSQNIMNKLSPLNTSGYKGVSFDRARNKWTAEVRAGTVRRRLGRFATKEEAADAYRVAALELHGEFARFD